MTDHDAADMPEPAQSRGKRTRRAEPISKRVAKNGTVSYEFRADLGAKPNGSRKRTSAPQQLAGASVFIRPSANDLNDGVAGSVGAAAAIARARATSNSKKQPNTASGSTSPTGPLASKPNPRAA